MKRKTLVALMALFISQGAFASPIKKCLINGKIVYSDNVCKEQGSEIDLLNATPPTLSDQRAAEMRNFQAKKAEEQKAAEKARIQARDANCEVPARNVAALYDRAKRHPANRHFLKDAIAAEENLKLQCPNHIIVNRF